jgi:hypothetical protein
MCDSWCDDFLYRAVLQCCLPVHVPFLCHLRDCLIHYLDIKKRGSAYLVIRILHVQLGRHLRMKAISP